MIALLICSILFAGWHVRNVPILLAYFSAQLLSIVVGYTVYLVYGDGPFYGIAYATLTCVVLLTLINIAWRLAGIHAIALAGLLALTVTRMAYFALGHQPEWYDWIGLLEGGVLFWAGLIVGTSAPFRERTGIHLSLGLLLLSQTAWRWGYYIHMPGWNELNWIVSPALPIVGFTVIGLLARHEALEETNRLRWQVLKSFKRG